MEAVLNNNLVEQPPRNPVRFLNRKRSSFYTKSKLKHCLTKQKKEKKFPDIDFDLIKDNFRHFLHVDWENTMYDKELSNICKYLTLNLS